MPRLARNGLAYPPAVGQHLQSSERQAAEQAVLERLVHVLHGPHLGAHPALADLLVKISELRFGCVARSDSIERGLRGEHARFHREVNAFEPQRVEKPCRIADNQRTVDRTFRQRQPTALGQRLRAVADHLAAPQQLADKRVQLELLECDMRIERGILVVEARDETNRQPRIRHRVDESAAEFLLIERISEGVHHGTARQAGRRARPTAP